MAFERPSLTTIIERVLADLTSRLATAGSVLRRSVAGSLGRALAGASHELHGRIDYFARQVIVDTADSEYLERWASVWGVRRRAADFATGVVRFTGLTTAVIPTGTILRRSDGIEFEVTTGGSIFPTIATLPVIAREAGSAGNTLENVTLALLQPIPGVQSTAVVVTGGITGGVENEADDLLRERLLARIQDPPQGGSQPDYERWALEVPGVTRAWVYPREMGAGTVTVRFVRDDDASIIPDSAAVAAVQAYIEERRPVTAEVFVVAPIGAALNLSIQLSPNTLEVQQAVEAELRDLIRREAEPGGTILISRIREAISTAPGELDHRVISPADNVVASPGQIFVLGTITWSGIP